MENLNDCSQQNNFCDLVRLQVLDMSSKAIVHLKHCEYTLGKSKALEDAIRVELPWRYF